MADKRAWLLLKLVDSVRRADPPDAIKFVLRNQEREVGATQAKRRLNARLCRNDSRHHNVERIARPYALGERAVENRVGTKQRRF